MKCYRVSFKLFYNSGEKDIYCISYSVVHFAAPSLAETSFLEGTRGIPLITCPVIKQMIKYGQNL